MNENFIQINGISKHFGNVKAVDDVSFSIKEGEFFSLLGPSGCGKTTLLRLLAGFEYPTNGNLLIDGSDITALPPDKRPTNMVFQNYAIFPHINVEQNIRFGLRKLGLTDDEIKKRVNDVLALVKLEGYEERFSGQLSGGQRQRVALARALVRQPKVLLLDEPLGALDAELRKQMQLFLKEIQKKIQITFIFITHDQEEAIFLSDRIAVLNNHKFEQVGSPKDLYYSPQTTYMAKFFGECNLINCQFLDEDTNSIKVKSEFGNFVIPKNNNATHELEFVYGIRPEEVKLVSKNENSMQVKIKDISFKGSTSTINVTNEKGDAFLKIQNISSNISQSLSIGTSINIEFNTKLGTIFTE